MPSILSVSGLASGLDTKAIVDALVNVERAPIRRIQTEQSALSRKGDKFEAIRGLLNTLKDSATALTDEKDLASVVAESSEESAFTVTADGTAGIGNFDLQITGVAQVERTYGGAFAAKDQTGLFGTGTLSITVGADTQVDITVDASTTLESLAEDINASDADVTASIAFDGTDYRMMVSGNRTGETDGAVAFAETGTTIGLYDVTDSNQYQAATSAEFYLDGFYRKSESNLIDDAIEGVSITIAEQTTGTQTLELNRDSEVIGDLLQEFADAYNGAYGQVNYEIGGPASDRGSLFGESTLRTIQQRLSTTITSPVSGLTGVYQSLGEIGVSIDREGVMSLDRTKLDTALDTDRDGVNQLLRADPVGGNDGVMADMVEVIDALTNTTDGMITNRLDGIDDRTEDLDGQILRMEARIDQFESNLNSEFTAMEQLLGNMQGQSAQLNAMLAGLLANS